VDGNRILKGKIMKIANYDKTTGKLLGWYDSEIHGVFIPEVPEVLNLDGTVKTKAIPASYDISSIPKPNIEVSETDWQIALDKGYNFVDAKTKTLSIKDFSTFTDKQTAKLSYIKSSFNSTLEAGYVTTSKIKMDATMQAVTTLKAGYDLAVAAGVTTMSIRDYDNVVHTGVAIADVQAVKYS